MFKKILFTCCSFVLFLTGCWDQNLLVNKKLVNGVSFDLTEDNQILGTVRALNIQNKGGGQFELNDELVQAKRPNFSGLGIDVNNKLPGLLDATKSHIILVSEELATKRGINHILDQFYRPRDAYINSRIVMTKGKAADILSLEPETSPIAFVILQGLKAAEVITKIPKSYIFTTWSQTVDPGIDTILPYVFPDEKDKITIGGIDLFNQDKYTGVSLNTDQGPLLLLLMDKLERFSELALQLHNNRSIAYKVIGLKRDLTIKVNQKTKKITVKIKLKLITRLTSYSNNIEEPINIEKLRKEISTELTKQETEITKLLVKANCDALGIGRRIASSNPDFWKKIDWEKEYKNVQFKPIVKVKIEKTGTVY